MCGKQPTKVVHIYCNYLCLSQKRSKKGNIWAFWSKKGNIWAFGVKKGNIWAFRVKKGNIWAFGVKRVTYGLLE